MFTLIRSFRSRSVYLSEVVSFTAALVIAEIFYKFKSFLLETAAFLVTWLVLAIIIETVVNLIAPRAEASRSA